MYLHDSNLPYVRTSVRTSMRIYACVVYGLRLPTVRADCLLGTPVFGSGRQKLRYPYDVS